MRIKLDIITLDREIFLSIVLSIIVGSWVLWVLTIATKLFIAIILAAITFFLFRLLFRNITQLQGIRYSKSYVHFQIGSRERASLPLISFVVFIVTVIFFPSQSHNLYQLWQEIPFGNWLRFLVTIPLMSFFPGYIILTLLDRKIELSKTGLLTLSPLLSIFFISLIGFIITVLGFPISEVGINAFAFFYIILLTFYAIFHLRLGLKRHQNDNSNKNWIDVNAEIVLLLVVILVLILAYSIQSEYGLYPGDERGLFGESLIFERTFPVTCGKYGPYPYWTNIFFSLFFVLSGFPAANAYIILHFFIVVPILSFYLFASTFFKRDQRIAIVGTVMFPLFAGFGWFYAMISKFYFQQNFESLHQLINAAGDKTYDIWNCASQFAYTLDTPEIVGISCFLVAIYIVRRRWKAGYLPYILLLIMVTLGYLAHGIYDISVFVILFTLYQFFSKEKTAFEYRKMGLSILIGLLMVGLIDFIAPGTAYTADRFGLIMANTMFIGTCSLLVVGIFLSFFRGKINTNLPSSYKSKFPNETLQTLLATVILFVYSLCFVVYFMTFQDLVPLHSVVYTEYAWPWFMYPLRFGLVGLLAVGTIAYCLLSPKKFGREGMIFLFIWALLILTFCWLGHTIWFLPSSIKSSILENKLQKYLWIPLCLLASYGLTTFLSRVKQSSRNQLRTHKLNSSHITGVLILSLILVGGVTSMLFQVEHFTIADRRVSTQEFNALEYLNSIRAPNVSVATVTSHQLLHDYAGIPNERIFDRWWESLLYDTSSLEACVNFLFNYNIRYLYLASRDIQYVNRYTDSYVFKHLVQNLPIVFGNTEVQIYELPTFSPPSAISSLAVVVPNFINVRQPPELDEHTVALWHFDEGSGENVGDSSGNGNNGTLYNASWVVGKFGSGLLFNGINTSVDCGNDASLDITGDIRIEAWVKLNKNWNSTSIIVIKAPGTDWHEANWYLRVEKTREVLFIWGDGINYKWYQSVPKLEVERWYHLAVEWDKIFVDGEKVATTQGGNATSHTTNTYALCIGASVDNHTFFNGIIDELHILNSSTAKTADIKRIFDYYYPTEIAALSHLNYTIISKDYDLHTFSTIITTDSNVANAASFLEWVETGRTLVILNTYNFGPIANLFIESLENDTVTSDGIQGRHLTLSIPNISIPKIKPLENVYMLSNYTNSARANDNNQTSPFALLKTINQGKIIYVYLAPYLNSLQEEDNSTTRQILFSNLKHMPLILELNTSSYHDTVNRLIYPPPNTHIAIAKDANFTGNINLQFDAFTLFQTGNLYAKMIKSKQVFQNSVCIQNIEGFGLTFSTINGRCGKFLDGSWNYALVRLNGDFNWTIRVPAESEIRMRIITNGNISDVTIKNDTLQMIGVYCQLGINSTEILVKNLHLSMNGQLRFANFYHKFPFWLNQTGMRVVPYSNGDCILFDGDIEFPVYIIKTNTFYISSFKIYGDCETPFVTPPEQVVPWESIVFSPIIAIIAIADFAIILHLRSHMQYCKATQSVTSRKGKDEKGVIDE